MKVRVREFLTRSLQRWQVLEIDEFLVDFYLSSLLPLQV